MQSGAVCPSALHQAAHHGVGITPSAKSGIDAKASSTNNDISDAIWGHRGSIENASCLPHGLSASQPSVSPSVRPCRGEQQQAEEVRSCRAARLLLNSLVSRSCLPVRGHQSDSAFCLFPAMSHCTVHKPPPPPLFYVSVAPAVLHSSLPSFRLACPMLVTFPPPCFFL